MVNHALIPAVYVYTVLKTQINTILVPVDFSENTEVAVSKALEFLQGTHVNSTLHLFHVQRIKLSKFISRISTAIAGYTRQQVNLDIKNSSNRLEGLKESIEKKRKDIKVLCWVSFGDSVQESITKKAKQISADLIIIGKHSHHSLLPFLNTIVPSKLAGLTGIPVLTAKPGSLHQEIKTVVIPVSHRFPISKLEILAALHNVPRPHVRLVTLLGNEIRMNDAKHMLLYTFRAFKSQFSNPVNYEVIEGGNKARALLKYCNKVSADILIVYPGAETQVGTWINSHISDLVPADSKTQILAISPG